MKYYIIPENDSDFRGIAYIEKTLRKFAAKQTRFNIEDGTKYQVYRTKAAFQAGFDFTYYELRDGKLKKSNAQPIVELNRLLLGG